MMKWLLILTALMIPTVAVAQEKPEKPKWIWITTCSTIGENSVEVVNEKSANGSELHGFEQYLLFIDAKTGQYTYKFLLSADILCTMMHREVYESRR